MLATISPQAAASKKVSQLEIVVSAGAAPDAVMVVMAMSIGTKRFVE
ncbi:hypothetical protein [Mesorhizobium intechi]|nr:hypothetical protein [Mesorhizobium intechi]